MKNSSNQLLMIDAGSTISTGQMWPTSANHHHHQQQQQQQLNEMTISVLGDDGQRSISDSENYNQTQPAVYTDAEAQRIVAMTTTRHDPDDDDDNDEGEKKLVIDSTANCVSDLNEEITGALPSL